MSPRKRKIDGADAEKAVKPAAAGQAAHPHFRNHGGPVIANPEVTSSFWGAGWATSANQSRAGRLNQFLLDLLKSKYMNILTQYGVGSGTFAGETFIDNVQGQLSDGDIHSIIQDAINNGKLSEPNANSVLIIYLDDATGVKSTDTVLCEPKNDNAFGYHFFFRTTAGNDFYYAVIPGLTDQCVSETCTNPNTCSLQLSKSQEQRQTQVTSHEFSEMVTDPRVDAWFDDDGDQPENGDICNGDAGTISVGKHRWNVQRMYSKADDLKKGSAGMCVLSPRKPIPPVH